MKQGMYIIWDETMEMWSPIYLQRNAKFAIKSFHEELEKQKDNLKVGKENFKIYQCGEFDDEDPINPIRSMIIQNITPSEGGSYE